MKNFLKGKVATAIIILATFVLAGVAIFTAIRLYQLRSQPVAPNVPSSFPKASETNVCTFSFTLTLASPTPTATPSRTPTATPSESPTVAPSLTPTPTGTNTPGAPNTCGGTCGSNSNCQSNYSCYQGFCRNPSCPTKTNCICGSATPTPKGTPAPILPNSGVDWPTMAGAWIGVMVILGSLLLAL